MKAITKIMFLDDNGEKFFGEGPARLLHGIEEYGSLRAAAMSMNMAYTKALKLIRNAETALDVALICRSTGGKDGGGSTLTAEGKEWLQRYEAYRDACKEANGRLYLEFFPELLCREDSFVVDLGRPFGNIGCVIMASGLGKRFGSNKLLADFHGKPMIQQILDATEGIFAQRVVVTRTPEVADLCEKRGIRTVLHNQPHRSDTVRLGLEAMPEIERCMFTPADQPLLHTDTVAALALASTNEPDSIWRPVCEGVHGSPVVFPKWSFEELMHLPEGKGGGVVIKKYPERLRTVTVQDIYELKDVDCPEDLEELLKR